MAWKFDNAAGDSKASPLGLKITVGGDSNRLLVMQVLSHKWLPSGQSTPTVMVGLTGSNSASAATMIVQRKPGLGTADSTYHGLFYFLNPPTGSDSISVVLASATQLSLNAISYSRVQQKAPEVSGADTWSVTTRGGDSLSITPVSGSALIVDAIQARNPTITFTARAGQTARGTMRGDSLAAIMGDVSGTTPSTAFKSIWTWSKTGTRGSHLMAAFTMDYIWDGDGKVSTSGSGQSLEANFYTFNTSGNKVSVSGSSGGNQGFSYSSAGNVVSISGSAGYSYTFNYSFSPSGNVVNVSGAAQYSFTAVVPSDFTWDTSGNKVATSGFAGWVANLNYSFDTSGNKVSISGAAGYSHTYNFAFDTSGSKVSISGFALWVAALNYSFSPSGEIVVVSGSAGYESSTTAPAFSWSSVGFVNVLGAALYSLTLPAPTPTPPSATPTGAGGSPWPGYVPNRAAIRKFKRFQKKLEIAKPVEAKPATVEPKKIDLVALRSILKTLEQEPKKLDLSGIHETLSKVNLQSIIDEGNQRAIAERQRQQALIKEADRAAMLRQIFTAARNEQERAAIAKKRKEEEELLELIFERLVKVIEEN